MKDQQSDFHRSVYLEFIHLRSYSELSFIHLSDLKARGVKELKPKSVGPEDLVWCGLLLPSNLHPSTCNKMRLVLFLPDSPD